MTDLWSFLLQTLTASGVAALLLVVKAIFHDKLFPRWQFAIWGVLGLVLLIPAGIGGRYVLINWPLLVEALKTILTGDYSLTHVLAPIPLPSFRPPAQLADWLYMVYGAGVLAMLARYGINYLRLRQILRRGTPSEEARTAQIRTVAAQYGLSACRSVEVPGLTSAFVCGVFHPVIALPAGNEVDDKVILHELLHLKYRDVGWGLAICLFRCIHWCNPLLWYCADRAGNDLEARCDQHVLELLAGEERRDYGRILLSMTDEQYARTPGTSSMANGGQNIRRRIEAIARFKKYPAGMELVSVCIAVALAVPLLVGSRPQSLSRFSHTRSSLDVFVAMSSARTIYCTTPAGAVDTYAKSVLAQNGYYRAMCAPLSQQEAIADHMLLNQERHTGPLWDPGLPALPDVQSGYTIYNLHSVGEESYEGLLVMELSAPPDGRAAEDGVMYLAVQNLQVEKENGRWVVIPQEGFLTVETAKTNLATGCQDLPSYCYQGHAVGFTVSLKYQMVFTVDSYIQSNDFFFSSLSFDATPQPHAEFSLMDHKAVYVSCEVSPDEALTDLNTIHHIGVSCAAMLPGEDRPSLPGFSGGEYGNAGGSSTDGSIWGSRLFGPEQDSSDWNTLMDTETEWFMCGGGSGISLESADFSVPEAYAADLYLNGEKASELTLLPVEGGLTP